MQSMNTVTIRPFICASDYFHQYFVIFGIRSFSLWLGRFIKYSYSFVCVVGRSMHTSVECAHTVCGGQGKEGIKHPLLSLCHIPLKQSLAESRTCNIVASKT